MKRGAAAWLGPPLAHCLGLALALGLCGACSSPVTTSAPHRSSAKHTSAQASDGQWSWSRWSVQPGSLRLEREGWQLQVDAMGVVRGTIVRENRFLSTDGQPFACIQGLSYARVARYRLEGKTSPAGFELAELSSDVRASPCESGERPLRRYHIRSGVDGELLVDWDEGSQVLSPILSASALPKFHEGRALEGRWSWQKIERESGLERIETEDWVFVPPAGSQASTQVHARYRRLVRITDTSGAIIPCAGSDRYQFADEYQLVGTRAGLELELTEASVKDEEHPCVTKERVLDSARAHLYDDALVLEWRGGRIQVLHPGAP